MKDDQYNSLYNKSYLLRERFIKIFSEIGYGHLTSAFSETEILATLYYRIMKIDKNKLDSGDSDRLVLSKGHGAGMLFPIYEDLGLLSKAEVHEMIRVGGDFSKLKELFCPAFEFYGGSLGIGLGMAAGMALGAKQNRDSKFIFCLLGDAECYEGSIWEAMLFAGHNELNNLVAIVDRNYLGCSDFTENMCRLEPFEKKWESCNWNTVCVDGHSYEELIVALENARLRRSSRPTCVIANTIKGKGVESVSNIPLMHGFFPTEDKVFETYSELKDAFDHYL